MAAGGIEEKVVGPLRPKVTRARERGILFAGDMKGTSNGPSGTPAPTGCVYRAAPENADGVRDEKSEISRR